MEEQKGRSMIGRGMKGEGRRDECSKKEEEVKEQGVEREIEGEYKKRAKLKASTPDGR